MTKDICRVVSSRKSLLPLALMAALGSIAGPGVAPLGAQHPAELTPRDKTELFLQHLVKVTGMTHPSKHQALVLEFEIGTALEELFHEHEEQPQALGQEKEGGAKRMEEACHQGSGGLDAEFVVRDFIQSALKELYPDYENALKLLSGGKLEEASASVKALALKGDPYLAAHARLLLAEIDLELANAATATTDGGVGRKELLEQLIGRCEAMVQKERLYLIADHRAVELIALAYERLEKPLFEFLEYVILLTDYPDLPEAVATRAKARLAALDEKAGKPLKTVAGWMDRVEKLLNDELTARDPTQAQETEVVSALDKLIELQEARERQT